MGQGGHIKLVNNTNSRMKRRYCKTYQMDAWRFPEYVNANASETFYVEWDEGIFHNKSDDRGTAIYYLENSPDKEVHITLYNANERNFNVTRLHFNGIPAVPEKVRWLHNGTMVVTVEEKEEKVEPEEKNSKEYDLTGPVKASRWMGWVKDSTQVNELDIPGTHDSFAYDLPDAVIKSVAKTQKIDIKEQLNIGCRFLDIRFNQDLAGRHGIIDCKDGLWKAMEWIANFLKENPKETIIMRMRLENEDNVSILNYNLNMLLTQYSQYFWRNGGKKAWPTIGEVRGKIIVLDNLEGDFFVSNGIGLKYNGGAPYLLIQDIYDPKDKLDVGQASNPNNLTKYKYKVVKENIDIPYDPNKEKINYVSAVSGWAGAAGNGLSPKDYADYMNHRVVDYIKERVKAGGCYTGIMPFDFMDDNIAECVFKCNDLTSDK